MPFRSLKITKSGRMAPSSAISASPITWPPEIQGTSKPALYQTGLFRLLLVWASLLGIFYIGSCGYPRLLDQIDGQYAGAAREMISRNEWLVPTQNSIPRLRKPPLAYWMEILSLRSFGENEFAARLPICLATFAWFIATAGLAYECTRDKLTSLTSSLILATFFGTFQFCHLIMPEPVFGFLTTFSFWLLLRLAGKITEVRREGSSNNRRIRDPLNDLGGDTHKPPITNLSDIAVRLSSPKFLVTSDHQSPITLELILLWV